MTYSEIIAITGIIIAAIGISYIMFNLALSGRIKRTY